MPKGVYERVNNRITKQEVENFVIFINEPENKKIIDHAKKPHIAASKLYSQKANKHVSYNVSKRAMKAYDVIVDVDGKKYAIEKPNVEKQ